MQKPLIVMLLVGLSMFVHADDMDANQAEAKQITAAFFNDLKTELGKGMKAGGPVTAVGVCNSLAPAIAQKYSENGWVVGRTSLKLRNPDNAPDDWERQVLRRFDERRANGEPAETLVYSEVVGQGDARYFRFMKAIVMPPEEKMPCLKCHGEKIDPATAAVIDAHYPLDAARGYKAGQVRGAFTLKKKL